MERSRLGRAALGGRQRRAAGAAVCRPTRRQPAADSLARLLLPALPRSPAHLGPRAVGVEHALDDLCGAHRAAAQLAGAALRGGRRMRGRRGNRERRQAGGDWRGSRPGAAADQQQQRPSGACATSQEASKATSQLTGRRGLTMSGSMSTNCLSRSVDEFWGKPAQTRGMGRRTLLSRRRQAAAHSRTPRTTGLQERHTVSFDPQSITHSQSTRSRLD